MSSGVDAEFTGTPRAPRAPRPFHGGRGGGSGRGRGRGAHGYIPRPPAFRKLEDAPGYVIEQNVPGYTKDDLKLRVLNHPRLLELSMVNPPSQEEVPDANAPRPIFRRWRLPVDADVSTIHATIIDGVFKATVGAAEPIGYDTPIAIN